LATHSLGKAAVRLKPSVCLRGPANPINIKFLSGHQFVILTSSFPSFEYKSLVHKSDILLLCLFPAAQFWDHIQASIEHYQRLSSTTRELFDIDTSYQELKYAVEHGRAKIDEVQDDLQQKSEKRRQEEDEDCVTSTKLERLQDEHEQYQREILQRIGNRSTVTRSFYEAVSYSWGTDTSTTSISIFCGENVK
jgi:hypothetical protein